jgi:hypothetical protein
MATALSGWYLTEIANSRVRSSLMAAHGTATPMTRPSASSVLSSPKCRSSDPWAMARKSTTNGRMSPSLTPDSTFSRWRSRGGTRSLPTRAAANTGSVGVRTAAISSDSIQSRPTT